MLKLIIVLVVLAASVTALVWWLGSREPASQLARGTGPVWLVALKLPPEPDRGLREHLRDGIEISWTGAVDFALIGAETSYWDRFAILQGGAPDVSPLRADSGLEDAQVLRIQLVRPPRLALGLLRVLHATGLRRMPTGPIDPNELAASTERADVMPSFAAMQRLLASPQDTQPVMVNYLAYRDTADYPPSSRAPGPGSAAYARYGSVALQTVYRTGGALLFYARVEAVLREAQAGPTTGRWDDVAAMRYPQPKALLAMEQVETYRAALHHRDAGLERTVVIATHIDDGAARVRAR